MRSGLFMRHFLFIFCIAILTTVSLAADNLDSLLTVQRLRAGSRADALFTPLTQPESQVSAVEKADYKFLLAYLPLADLASLDAATLLENIRLARRARSEFSWGPQITDELFRHFVLPHRVSQEPFVNGWRSQFFAVLAPRLKNLSMTDAALEVNHWCHEVATYKPSDGRDQDPLTTIRAGLGRCEEEMILAIDALRSVGIPARQCYTPYWAHTDDNHAWTEVWADGAWHYFGACEPEPILNRGWFSNAATRAMLVVSTAYGDYYGNEPVLKRYGSTTLVNSTAVYGKTHTLHVTLVDGQAKPVPQAKVIFNLFNYGCFMPAVALTTDSRGQVTIVCGQGTWFLTAGTDSAAALATATAADTALTMTLAPTASLPRFTTAEYIPPPATEDEGGVQQDSLFRCRTGREDSLREDLWTIWAREQKLPTGNLAVKPDSTAIMAFAAANNLKGSDLLEILRGARGNWGNLYFFLTGRNPEKSLAATLPAAEMQARLLLLGTLSDKDRRDFTVDALTDHFAHCTSAKPLLNLASDLAALDSTSRKRVEDYVITPRIGDEPSSAWRQKLTEFFLVSSLADIAQSAQDSVLLGYLRRTVVVDTSRDRMGPPLSPAQTLAMARGTQRDVETLYAAFCRVRGIPARFSPVTGNLERWDADKWVAVNLKPVKKSDKPKPAVGNGQLVVEAAADTTVQNALYLKDWGVQQWTVDHLTDLDFGYHTPFKDITWPQDLPEGRYALLTGLRRKDGSAPVALTWFEIEAGKTTRIPLRFRP
jgi:transglutaminase-like putative cysteine protease